MGISSDGQLNYGWTFDEIDESVNEICEDFQHLAGWKAIHEPLDLDDEGEDSYWEELPEHGMYFAPKENSSCLVVGRHCSYEYSLPILSHRECCYRSSRGDAIVVDLPDKETITRWHDEIIAEAKRVGFDTDALGEPKLILTSMYG